jgi:outer membrane lipoprotein-sorting protein
MKKIILTFTALLALALLQAQTAADARTVLDKAYSAYENSKGINILFTITTTGQDGTKYPPQKGSAQVKGNKFKIETSTINTWFDGKTQWVLMKEMNEVNISYPSNEELATISPLALLSMYKTGFTLNPPVSKTVNGKSALVIEMVPTGNKSDFKKISVAIDARDSSVVQVDITLKDGMRNRIDVNSYNTNFNYSDAEFLFNIDQYKGVEIVDLR